MRKNFRSFAALFTSFLIFLTLGISSADDFEDLRKNAQNIKTLSADFTLEKRVRILTKPIVSKGRLYYKAPRFIRWEYISPIKHLMLMGVSGARVYMWSGQRWVPDNAQSEARTLVMDEMNKWLTGRFDEDSAFRFTYRPGPPPLIILTPKEEIKRFISQIVFSFSRTTGLVQSVEIVEDQGNRTKIIFKNEKVDIDLDESLFEKP